MLTSFIVTHLIHIRSKTIEIIYFPFIQFWSFTPAKKFSHFTKAGEFIGITLFKTCHYYTFLPIRSSLVVTQTFLITVASSLFLINLSRVLPIFGHFRDLVFPFYWFLIFISSVLPPSLRLPCTYWFLTFLIEVRINFRGFCSHLSQAFKTTN